MTLTAERLRELVHYDPETGIFTRLTDNRRGCHIGDVVGSRHRSGYINAYVDGATYSNHRLAWLYVTGEWPNNEVDHLNGKKADNRFSNLRDATKCINMQNEVRARKSNACGFAGVTWRADRSTWIATIRVDGQPKRLGSFDTAEAAHDAYLSAKRRYHPGFTL